MAGALTARAVSVARPPVEAVRERIVGAIRRTFRPPCRRILLVQPLQVGETDLDVSIARNRRYYTYPPYALALLAANLDRRGYATSILDLNYEVFDFIFRHPDRDLAPETLTTVWKDSLGKALDTFEPDVVGVSCTFTMGHEVLMRTAEFIKHRRPSTPVVAGGVHTTNAREIVLRDAKHVDFVSLYEGDVSFPDLLDVVNGTKAAGCLSQLAALVERAYCALDERCPPRPEDLNVVPEFGDLPLGRYSDLGEIGTFRYWRPVGAPAGVVLSNRGCRARCTFCSVANFNGPGVRQRDVRSVVDEIQLLRDRYGIRHITWLDDDLFLNTDRTLALFTEIAQRRLGITWDASNGVIASAAVAHEELIHAAAESGCIGMYFGIESGNEDILRRIQKPSGIKHFLKLGAMMEKYPQIFTRGFLIIGFPEETLRQVRDTVELALAMDLDWYTVQQLTPLPSTAIYDEMIDLGLIEAGSLNTEGEGFTMFSVRESERQRRIERRESKQAREFADLFAGRMDVVPSREQVTDLWFLIDYRINYEKILSQQHPLKLEKMRCFLRDVSDRMTVANPISNLFLSIVESKLGDAAEAARRKSMAKRFVEASQYWGQRFRALGLLDAQGRLT